MPEDRSRNVYVIELDRAVLAVPRFKRANPEHDPEKSCLYVGMTALDPAARFEQHRSGYKACSLVRDYGRCIRWRLFKRYNPMTYEQAEKREVQLACDLRQRGYAVWQK